jgi:hypothetical protein
MENTKEARKVRVIAALREAPEKSTKRLAEELDVTYDVVSYHRKHQGIAHPQADYKAQTESLRQQGLSAELKGRIVGTLLGDGYLVAPTKDKGPLSCLVLKHGEAQRAWLKHKGDRLGFLAQESVDYRIETEAFGKPCTLYRLTTIRHPELLVLRQLAYDTAGVKRVTKALLDLLTEEGLAWWYYDDGYLRYGKAPYVYPNYFLCTHSFTLAEHKIIRDFLFRRFKIKTTVLTCRGEHGNKMYYLYFAKDTRDKLTSILHKYPVACLSYKVARSSETLR